jgi:hypothetical protein
LARSVERIGNHAAEREQLVNMASALVLLSREHDAAATEEAGR